jgi:uncharacterized damage-inducible protein DinB
MNTQDFTNNLFFLLKEFFESPPAGAACLDKKTGLFDTLSQLSAAQASMRISDAPSIAAHCEHMRFYQNIYMGGLQGKEYGKIDWKKSWIKQSVTDEEWQTLQTNLRMQYNKLMTMLESFDT